MVFDTTVRRELARSFGATLVVILTIVLTMLLIRTVGQAAKGQIAPQDVVLLLGFVALSNLPTMLALSLFVAVVVSLGRMYRDSEMVIWFASGIGLRRFVRPVLHTTWPVLLVIALLTLFVVPWGSRSGLELRDRYAARSDLSRVTPGVFQQSSDGSRVFFIERSAAEASAAASAPTDVAAGDTGPAVARNVFVLSASGDHESVTSASRGRIDSIDDTRVLVLERGQRTDLDRATGDKARASFEDYRVRVDEKAARLATQVQPRAMPTADLLRDPTLRHQGELAWRIGLALGAANLLLLGIGLSATTPRRASNWNLLFALLGFVVYYNLIGLSQAWVAAGRLGIGAALLGLHGAAAMLALGLLAWRDQGATHRLWPRKATA
ncbi:MAG: LPS export ABC transporter permease LptF [Burkholderiaceae bacterium]|nr:LPS export ABC transporter permease LptF [Burkholderiaceae bacterium]